MGQVPGAEPSIHESGRRPDRVAPVAGHGTGGLEPELADLPVGYRSAVVVSDCGLHTGPWSSHGVEGLLVVGVQCRAQPDAARLGRRVADGIWGVEPLPGLGHQGGGRGSATHHDRPHGSQVMVVEAGVPEQQRYLGRHPIDGWEPVAIDEFQQRSGVPPVHDVDGGSRRQLPGQLGHHADVGEGCAADHVAPRPPCAAAV